MTFRTKLNICRCCNVKIDLVLSVCLKYMIKRDEVCMLYKNTNGEVTSGCWLFARTGGALGKF